MATLEQGQEGMLNASDVEAAEGSCLVLNGSSG